MASQTTLPAVVGSPHHRCWQAPGWDGTHPSLTDLQVSGFLTLGDEFLLPIHPLSCSHWETGCRLVLWNFLHLQRAVRDPKLLLNGPWLFSSWSALPGCEVWTFLRAPTMCCLSVCLSTALIAFLINSISSPTHLSAPLEQPPYPHWPFYSCFLRDGISQVYAELGMSLRAAFQLLPFLFRFENAFRCISYWERCDPCWTHNP